MILLFFILTAVTTIDSIAVNIYTDSSLNRLMSQREIDELALTLQRLRIEFNSRANEITNRIEVLRRHSANGRADAIEHRTNQSTEDIFVDAQEEQQQNDSSNDTSTIIKIGDWVEIINEYRYIEKGKIGKVYKFNKNRDRVWFRSKRGDSYQRAPWNVRKVKEPNH